MLVLENVVEAETLQTSVSANINFLKPKQSWKTHAKARRVIKLENFADSKDSETIEFRINAV